MESVSCLHSSLFPLCLLVMFPPLIRQMLTTVHCQLCNEQLSARRSHFLKSHQLLNFGSFRMSSLIHTGQ